MATKRYCDFCSSEIPPGQTHTGQVSGDVTLHRKGVLTRVTGNVLISVEFDDGHGTPDICPACVFDAARSIDPSPQQGEDRP